MSAHPHETLDVLVVGPLTGEVSQLSGATPVGWPASCPNPDLVIAVDSGFDRCLERGWPADILVGDFDSLSGEGLRAAEQAGLEIVRLPVDKDRSDMHVALEVADARGATSVTVVGMVGGRLDHQLAVLGSLALSRSATVVAIGPSADAGQMAETDLVHIVQAGCSASVSAGLTFSVIGLLGDATVSVRGARWPLDRHTLAPLSSHGLSNEAVDAGAFIECHDGVVAVIVPPQAP